MKKTSGTRLLLVALLTLPLTYAGCSKSPSENRTNAAAQQEIGVRTSVVEGRTVERRVEVTGSLAPWDEVIVRSEIEGVVEGVRADLGDSIRAGDVLATLDDSEERLALDEAEAAHSTDLRTVEKEKARFEDASTTLKRYEELYKGGMASVAQYDSARTQHEVTKAQLMEAQSRLRQSESRVGIAKKRLSDTVIRSPISGMIRKRHVSRGDSVKSKDAVFEVVSAATLKFRGTVPEGSVPFVRKGQKVELAVEAYRDRTFGGTIERISPALETETRSLEIEASVPNPGGLLKPGFFAKGVVVTGRDSDVPFVPEPAVYTFLGINKVFVISEGKATELLVKTGERKEGMVEVRNGIKPGSTVAISNLANLFDGAKVKVQN